MEMALEFVEWFAFLALLATNPQWTVPPWPILGSLAVITMATSAASMFVGVPTLHAAGVIASESIEIGARSNVELSCEGSNKSAAAGRTNQ